MALILQLETSSDICSVALGKDGICISSAESLDINSHSEKLTILILACLQKVNMSIKDVNAVCVSGGPGSYTSLRVGVSVAKGICYTLGIPLIAIDSLDILIEGIEKENIESNDYLIPMIDARRMEIYHCIVSANGQRIAHTAPIIVEFDPFVSYLTGVNKLHVCGNGAQKYYDRFASDRIQLHHTTASAIFMTHKAYALFLLEDFEDVSSYTPNYLKAPNITKSQKKLL